MGLIGKFEAGFADMGEIAAVFAHGEAIPQAHQGQRRGPPRLAQRQRRTDPFGQTANKDRAWPVQQKQRFSRAGDARVERHGQLYCGWYGWRWQRAKTQAAATEKQRDRLKPILGEMTPGETYTLHLLQALAKDVAMPKMESTFRRGQANREEGWAYLQQLIRKYDLINHADHLGHEVDTHYMAEAWWCQAK